MLAGVVIGWWIALPILTAAAPPGAGVEAWAQAVFRTDVRFLGAGVIGVAAIWTLLRIIGPVVARHPFLDRRKPGAQRGGAMWRWKSGTCPSRSSSRGSLAVLVPIAFLLWSALAGGAARGVGTRC